MHAEKNRIKSAISPEIQPLAGYASDSPHDTSIAIPTPVTFLGRAIPTE
jgi:hypothetical protein